MAFIVILVILALVFGVGAVLEGLLWALLIGVVLLAIALFLGWKKLGPGGRRS